MTEQQPPITYELSTPEERPEGGRSPKTLAIAAIAVVVVLALAGGAFAVVKKLDGGGPQPQDVLPASVIAFARVDVDPSAGQKIALFKMIRKFPEAADQIGIKSADQDVRKLLFDKILEAGSCDMSYDKDVKPWLGKRIGIGVDKHQTPLIAIQVSDEDKAEKGIKALFRCADEKGSVAFLDGYAIAAETQEKADAAVKAAEKKSLADNKAFIKDFDDLGEQGVASGWADFKGLAQIPDFRAGFEAGASESGLDGSKMLKQMGSAASTVRAQGSTLELAALTGLPDVYDKIAPISMSRLPADTVAALSFGGFGDQIATQFDALLKDLGGRQGALDPSYTEGMTPEEKAAFEDYLKTHPIGPEDYLKQFEQETGLKVPDDLETLFGDGLTIAIGSKNLESIPTFSGFGDFTSLDIALQMTTDPDKAFDLAQRLAKLGTQVGLDLSTTKTEHGAVIATNQDAAKALDGKGKLGADPTFTSVMPYGDDTVYGVFVDVATIRQRLKKSNPPEDVVKDLDQVKAVKAVGVSYGTKGKHLVISVRVALAK